ncbi:DNA-binding protein [Trueperella pyogenes]|nr:DNA-binding protein [Trueperella pyogenes]
MPGVMLGVKLDDLVATIRAIGVDTQRIEVKSAVGKSILETLSAFSNSGSGTLLIGFSEKDGFTPTLDFDAAAQRDALVSRCAELTPRVNAETDIVEFEGGQVLVATIPEIPPYDKPCYITERGRYNGAYRRLGDGDHRLLKYEVDRLLEAQHTPTWDEEAVLEATVEDLESDALEAFLAGEKKSRPRSFSRGAQQAMAHLRITRNDHPTLAALLALGEYPQEFFPRLTVSFAVFPGTSKGQIAQGLRLLESRTFTGPIYEIVDSVLQAVQSNMSIGGMIDGAYRQELPDYPLVAVREAIVNALMHRDYSPQARGAQVQVNMFVDRLEVISPGGLFGAVTMDTLGTVGMSTTRNQRLATFLESPYLPGGALAENRGMGIQAIQTALEEALMPPAEMHNDLTSFTIVFRRRRVAQAERYLTAYDKVRNSLSKYESVSTSELVKETRLSRTAIQQAMNSLIEEGIAEPTEPPRSPRQRYRKTRAAGTTQRELNT